MRASTALALVRACHPEPTVAVTAVAAGLAISVGRPAWGVVLVAAAVFTGQLSVGWLNDYLDADRDRTVGRADKPLAVGAVSRRAVGVGITCAAALCVPLSLSTGWLPGAVHLLAVASAWSYDAWLKSTVASVVPYAVSFGLLPVFVVLSGEVAPAWWLVAAGALLGAGAHFANVLPDLADDAVTGVRGLPQRLGPRSAAVAVVLLLASMACLAFGPVGGPAWTGLWALGLAVAAVVASVVWGRGDRSRGLFRAVMVTALLAVGLLLVSPLG
ncbi:UbiA family prenyltransferase [Actinokineospora spheciospongiae]|uniref:UbiA family prenyltransferase n=1 Tax=Actinokineospora spheciospongiae TaxID=909613 RepID=UPI0004BC5E9B|nr:UbiA family prenyltransferase [Actinokineospora spheciospongiae]PWW63033.1 4-hydroxybenzoate polyprenyltransferase [Actinokineospora spheciospongiae]